MTNVLQGVLTEGDTGKPFFSDRDTSEEPAKRELVFIDEEHTFTEKELELAVETLRLRVIRAEMLGHRTVPIDDIRRILLGR